MARARRLRRERDTVEHIGWLPITAAAVCGLALIGIVGWYIWQRSTVVPHDKLSGCPVSGPVAVHAILVDRSDPLSGVQAERLMQLVEKIAVGAAIDERIDLYVLTAGGDAVATPQLSLCRPRSDGDPLTENPERLRRAFAQRFLGPLEATLEQMESPHDEPTSPIMESIKAVCTDAFGKLPRNGPAHLTIASDMIQNSPLLNQYQPYDIETFLRGPKMPLALADCHGADVDILYLTRPRDARFQTRTHQLFWEKFLERMNATLMSMERS